MSSIFCWYNIEKWIPTTFDIWTTRRHINELGIHRLHLGTYKYIKNNNIYIYTYRKNIYKFFWPPATAVGRRLKLDREMYHDLDGCGSCVRKLTATMPRIEGRLSTDASSKKLAVNIREPLASLASPAACGSFGSCSWLGQVAICLKQEALQFFGCPVLGRFSRDG